MHPTTITRHTHTHIHTPLGPHTYRHTSVRCNVFVCVCVYVCHLQDGCVRDLSQISTVDNDMVRYPSSNRQTNTTALTTTSNHPHTDTDTLRWSQNPIAALESDETDTTRVGSNSSLGVPTDLGAHFGDGGAPASLRHPSNGNVLGMAPTLPQIQEEDGQFSATHSTVNDNTVTDAPKTGSRVLSKTQSDLATGLRAARGAHASGDGVGGEASGGVNGASEGQAAASTAVPAPRARRRVAFRTLSEKDIAPHVADAGPASASDASAAAAVKEPSTAPLAMAKSAAAMSSGGNSYTSPRESSDGGARVTPTRATRSTCGPEGLEQGPTTPTASQQRALTKAKSHRFAEVSLSGLSCPHSYIALPHAGTLEASCMRRMRWHRLYCIYACVCVCVCVFVCVCVCVGSHGIRNEGAPANPW